MMLPGNMLHNAAFHYTHLVLVACLVLSSSTHATTTSRSTYIIQTQQQSSGQPYVRGTANQMLNVSIGRGNNHRTYLQMIDSGSELLSIPCNTPAAKQRRCSVSSNMYTLRTPALVSKKVCHDNTTGCFAPNPSEAHGSCVWSSTLTGGTGYNIYTGLFATDTVSLPGSLGQKLSWPGLFACFDSFGECPESGTECKAQYTSCPLAAPHLTCPFGTGLEAGMLFGQNSITTQLSNLGIIDRAVGFCYLPPVRNTNCAAPPISNTSRVVLGGGRLPHSIPNRTSMQSEPIILSLNPNEPNGSTVPVSPEFRTAPRTASMARYGGGAPSVIPVAAATILWDTGAFSQSDVPPNVYQAFVEYFNASLAKANVSGTIVPCGGVAEVKSLCGNNFYEILTPSNVSIPAPTVCNMIQLPAAASAIQVSAAEHLLSSLFPPVMNITMQHGAVASVPTFNLVHDCSGARPLAIAACSFMAPASDFWLASPWFNNHFTLFDMSAPDPRSSSSVGTMYWAPVSNCDM